jgi:hypothetical protein
MKFFLMHLSPHSIHPKNFDYHLKHRIKKTNDFLQKPVILTKCPRSNTHNKWLEDKKKNLQKTCNRSKPNKQIGAKTTTKIGCPKWQKIKH